jgi:hypothetical protein
MLLSILLSWISVFLWALCFILSKSFRDISAIWSLSDSFRAFAISDMSAISDIPAPGSQILALVGWVWGNCWISIRFRALTQNLNALWIIMNSVLAKRWNLSKPPVPMQFALTGDSSPFSLSLIFSYSTFISFLFFCYLRLLSFSITFWFLIRLSLCSSFFHFHMPSFFECESPLAMLIFIVHVELHGILPHDLLSCIWVVISWINRLSSLSTVSDPAKIADLTLPTDWEHNRGIEMQQTGPLREHQRVWPWSWALSPCLDATPSPIRCFVLCASQSTTERTWMRTSIFAWIWQISTSFGPAGVRII